MKHILLDAALLVLTLDGFSQCTPSFTWVQTAPNEITFTNTTVPIVQDSTFFTWFFGDNLTSTDQDPIHIYSGPDTVEVCMIVFDSSMNCSATYCDTVVVTGTLLCNNLAVYANSLQDASCAACPTGAMIASTIGGTLPYSFAWSSGGTAQATGQLLPGSYSVTVTDANGCTAADTGIIVIGPPELCTGSWNNFHLSTDSILFRGHSLLWSPYREYSWNFGDNTTGTGDTIIHEYFADDTFNVCMYIADSIYSCYLTICDTVVIYSGPPLIYCSADLYGFQTQWNQHTIYSNSTGIEFYWSWGDNTYDTLEHPTHVYNAPGTYTVCITVVDSISPNPCIDSMCIIITVAPGNVPYYVVTGITPVSVNESDVQRIRIFPNPAQDVLRVESDVAVNYTYRITDVTGRSVGSGIMLNNSVDLRNVTPGMYLIAFSNPDGELVSMRFVKE